MSTETLSAHPGAHSYEGLEPLFTELAALDAGDARRRLLREELIQRSLPLAENIARKFSGRGENFDDLLQIARVGLLAAIDRFDPGQGSPFIAYAVPTIMGEVRRHFRDYTWAVRVPRRLKEIQTALNPAIETLTQQLGRVPKAREIAEELGADLAEVTQALIARNAYQAASLDAGSGESEGDPNPLAILGTLGAEDASFESIDNYLAVKPLIAALPAREQQVLVLRFFHSMSQQEIASKLGCSQMQVSRILTRTLKSLREQALRD
ncbi:RNA polymerase sigma factor SigF [Nocardia cyriacigeorgica]|uniref:RNA polymerase sigma factor SigF n=1 Tax=Nocardia cyriacigeorgica TaxID=135487 RepID=UPI002459002E|nr:RNA polymerase sigma factor SigF [Nocardia cyriacigeorgica]